MGKLLLTRVFRLQARLKMRAAYLCVLSNLHGQSGIAHATLVTCARSACTGKQSLPIPPRRLVSGFARRTTHPYRCVLVRRELDSRPSRL